MNKVLLYGSLLTVLAGMPFANTNLHAQITAEQVATIKNVTNSVLSADGAYTAYTLSVPADPKKENSGNKSLLYVVHNATGKSRLYYSASSVSQIAFRPLKGTLTFLTRQGNNKTNAIYEIDLQGGEATQVYGFSSNILSYEWADDGEQIAFITMEKAVQPKTSLTYAPTFFEENYDLRNTYIIHVSNNTLKKVNVSGSAYMLAWAPNNKMLAVSTAPTGSVDDSYMKQSIYVIDANTNTVVSKIANEGKLGQFTWSPDSKQLAIVGAYDLNDPTDGTLSIVSAQGGKPTVIDGQFKGKYESIIWKNKDINFLVSEGTASSLGTISADGKFKKTIYKASEQHITTFSLSDKGLISFTANAPTHPSELFLLDNKKGTAQRKTFSNEWMNDLKWGKQEVISYKAKDGKFDVEGMVIYPLDYKEGTKYPLITVVHGGPESHYSNGWLTGYSNPGQMGATKGYVVFYPNYRGSTGRGVTYTYSSQADLAGKEFDDIVDGVDYLIAKGIVDEKRVGVTGGSYGGYASAWMSTYYSHRFAAAVMFVGISNNISKFGTSDIPNEMKLVHERGDIWDNWQKQLEISPIYHVDKAQTPILIMHGAEDPRVHPAQSMELYRHIKVRKPEVPVRLIYYPGEGHGNARSGSKYDYNVRLFQWFDTYLKSGDRKAPMPSLDIE